MMKLDVVKKNQTFQCPTYLSNYLKAKSAELGMSSSDYCRLLVFRDFVDELNPESWQFLSLLRDLAEDYTVEQAVMMTTGSVEQMTNAGDKRLALNALKRLEEMAKNPPKPKANPSFVKRIQQSVVRSEDIIDSLSEHDDEVANNLTDKVTNEVTDNATDDLTKNLASELSDNVTNKLAGELDIELDSEEGYNLTTKLTKAVAKKPSKRPKMGKTNSLQ